MEELAQPRPGWYVVLSGYEGDLSEWRYELAPPFDPHAVKLSETETALWSEDLQDAETPTEVRERASTTLRILNGALKLSISSETVEIASIAHVDATGKRSTYIKVEPATVTMRAFALRPVVTAYDAAGNIIPPPPPTRSRAQRWSELGRDYDVVADMLDHYGRADNWFDIYKTVELVGMLFGGEHKLKKALPSRAGDMKRLKRSADFYRHARKSLPEDLLTLGNAALLLGELVRAAMDVKVFNNPTARTA